MNYKNSEQFCKQKQQELLSRIADNGHVYISGNYETKVSQLQVYCPSCDLEINTTFSNYMRSRTGCLICGRKRVSEKLTNRVYSEETIQRMQKSANNRPNRGGQPRRWRENQKYRNWRSLVLNAWNNECAITGAGDQNLAVHHIISASSDQSLAYNVNNGIVISSDLHVQFHKTYGYRNNNFSQFKEFILKLINNNNKKLISSQGESEDSQGSETRVYDPERIMKLHELLGKIEL